jgi:hypothetical protein
MVTYGHDMDPRRLKALIRTLRAEGVARYEWTEGDGHRHFVELAGVHPNVVAVDRTGTVGGPAYEHLHGAPPPEPPAPKPDSGHAVGSTAWLRERFSRKGGN